MKQLILTGLLVSASMLFGCASEDCERQRCNPTDPASLEYEVCCTGDDCKYRFPGTNDLEYSCNITAGCGEALRQVAEVCSPASAAGGSDAGMSDSDE